MGVGPAKSQRSWADDTATFSGVAAATAHPPARAAEQAHLVEVVGPQPGRRHLPDPGFLIGRSSTCDHEVNEAEVSRRHCRIFKRGEQYVVEDLGSRNGTYVNGQRTEGARVLGFGDRIQVGRQTVLLLAHHDPLRDAVLQRQKMEALGQLGAGIAHDLNNLLGVLTSTLQHLQELDPQRTLGDDDVVECHEDLSAAVRSAADMTRRLVGFARRSSSPEAKLLDVTHLCSEVARLIRRTCPQSIEVQTRLEPAVMARGEPGELHQVLMNLCLNARDAMPDGGVLAIEAEQVEASEVVDAPFRPNQTLVRLSVSDTGHGMDHSTRDRIFEPFFTTKSGPSGTGLGLSAVYEIVTSHGGHICVDSEPGQGARFHVYLPAASGPTSRRDEREQWFQTSERPNKAARVLLVDDQDLVRRAAGRLLRAAGHQVLLAGGGAEAIEQYVAGARPDVVILDLDMPGMPGDVCWRRLQDVDPGVKVVFLSGSCDEGRRRRLLSDGALAFLHKPVDADVLRDAIQKALL